MELKFIWIQDYKNIKNTGFNFSNSNDELFNFINNELIIDKKVGNTPQNFFGNSIISVTGIVGKNGSGKTNLTEFINYNLAHASNGGLSTYIKSKGIIILDKWIFVQKNIVIENQSFLKSKGFKLIRFNNAPLDGGSKELGWHEMEMNKYIYYNPTFDLRGIPVKDNLVNISTTLLVYNDLYNLEKIYRYAIENKSNLNQLDIFDKMEKSRITDFILNFEHVKKYIDFLPEKIQISLDNEKNNSFLKRKISYSEEEDENKTISKLHDELDSLESFMIYYENYDKYFVRQRENSITKYYKIPILEQKAIFFRLFFLNIFRCLLNNDRIFPNDFFRRFLYNELEENPIDGFDPPLEILKLKNLILEAIDKAEWNDFEFPLPDNQNYDSDKKKDRIYEYLGTMEISVFKHKTFLNNIILDLDNLLENKRIFSYETLKEYSSGQKHLLTLYSRFFWAKNQISSSEISDFGVKGDSIIILIDEGEVALHPEWQRVFFLKVTEFLMELFDDKKIQLILTTHSPFVLSDIPKENVVFLDKDEEGNCIISNIDRENTFGANIYSLLTDSFFMDNTIGSFAEKKMKWALNLLKRDNSKFAVSQVQELKYIIDSIGEPIIKEQLEYLFSNKFVFDEVTVLKNRIVELENQLKEEKNDSDKN